MLAVGILGIILAMVLFLVLVYKGCVPYWAALVCALIVAVTNGINIVDSIISMVPGEMDGQMHSLVGGMVDLIPTMFPVVIFGAILGKIYGDTGAATSIANTLIGKLVKGGKNQSIGQIRITVLVVLVVAALCTLGGIDGYVLTFTMIPVCLVVSEMCDYPKRYIGGMMCLNCAFMIFPGAPQIYNIMGLGAMQSVGQVQMTAASGFIPGVVASLIIAVCGWLTLSQLIFKAKSRGEHFDWGTVERPKESNDARELPHFVVAILPLVVVFLVYTILPMIIHQQVHVLVALGLGILLALVTMARNLPKQDHRGNTVTLIHRVKNTLNGGANSYPGALMSVITPAGLAAVVTGTGAFGFIVGMLGHLPIHPVLLTIIFVCIVVALTSSPPAALMVAIPIIFGIIMSGPAAASFNPSALMRVAIVAASTFETLPFNGLIVLTLGLTHETHKSAYLPMFLMTVVFTFLATIVTGLMFMIYPFA